MEFLIYVVAIGMGLFGLGVGYRAFYTGSVGQKLGCLCYCVAAIIAIVSKSWIPLLIGWALTFVVRKVFEDPDQPLTPTQIQNYKKAAELGKADAQFEMGFLYQHGKDVSQDLDEAIRFYNMAAEQGHIGAQKILGALYSMDEGVPPNYLKAYMWLDLAASGLWGSDKEMVEMHRDQFLATRMNPQQIKAAREMVAEWHARRKSQPN